VSLLLELNIHLPPDRQSVIVDHFNYDSKTAHENHDVLLVQPQRPIRPDVKNFFGGSQPIAVPRAVGQVLGNGSPLLVPILRAPSTAYSYNPKEESDVMDDLFASGEQICLVSALQARNSARLTVLGSVEVLHDTWFDANVKIEGKAIHTGNQEFAKQLSGWAFKELGVLKVGTFQHHLNGQKPLIENGLATGEGNPTIYRIKNDVV
jgi:oligosaccharyltransferase complex subunit beta